MRLACLFLIPVAAFPRDVVIDRIAVIVGKAVIKLSDIERNLRLTEFLNREPLNLSAQVRRPAAERLIDQQVIRNEIASGGYDRATDAEAQAMLERLERDHYGSQESRLDAALERYGLTEDQLRDQLRWQLTVLRFLQQRFQPGVIVSDQDVQAYYDKHRAELERENPGKSTLAALEPKIRELVTGEDVNKDFEEWLARARERTHIEYREGAFQ